MKEDTHERARRLIDRLSVEGPAGNEAERAWLDSHLATCAECRRFWQALQSVDLALAAWPLAAPPAGGRNHHMPGRSVHPSKRIGRKMPVK